MKIGFCHYKVFKNDAKMICNLFNSVQYSNSLMSLHTCVMAVTERPPHMGDTPLVNMVRRACTNVLFEPGDTE